MAAVLGLLMLCLVLGHKAGSVWLGLLWFALILYVLYLIGMNPRVR